MNRKIFGLLMTVLMLASTLAIVMPRAEAQQQKPKVIVIPQLLEFGPTPCVDQEFTVTVEVWNVTNLYGVDIQFGWDEEWIGYVSHHKHIPRGTGAGQWPDGILYPPTVGVKDDVSEGVPMPGADPNSDYWLAEASMAPAAPFTGSGVAFDITFKIKKQPMPGEPDKVLCLNITTVTLADNLGNPIDCDVFDGTVIIHARPLIYPPAPKLSVLPSKVENIKMDQTFVENVFLHAWNETSQQVVDLDPFWDVAGFDFHITFDPTLIVADSVTIDPDNWFAGFWPNGIFTVKAEIDNVAGTIWIAFLGIPGDDGTHTPPSGQGRIVSVTFRAVYESATYPPPSCLINIVNSTVAGFPHPERAYPPWSGSDSAVPLDHFINSATYKAYFKPPGAWIDIYTVYPDGTIFGVGPNEPGDMYWPQKEVVVKANVTYNFWPEQNKDVAFQIIDPHGEIWGIICNRTDQYGVAVIRFRLPWPCDDPEYWFGVWKIVATVDVACKVVNDTLQFKYDYHVRVWKTTVDKDAYNHCETITVTIDLGTVSRQTFNVLITVTAVDETGVPFGFDYTWVTVGGAEWCTYANTTVTLSIHVPKFARAGVGTIYVQVLHNWPTNGGDSIYPTREPETIVHFGINAA